MKRAIGLILVSFVLGVAVQIAIAWGAVFSTDPASITAMSASGVSPADAATIQWWREHGDVTAATDALMVAERSNRLLTIRLIGGSDADVYTVDGTVDRSVTLMHDPARQAPWIRVLRIEAGWPRRCFRGERWERGVQKADLWPFVLISIPSQVAAPEDVSLDGAVALQVTSAGVPQDVLLPVRPIWGALLFDAAILVLPILLLLGTMVAVRWSWRRSRGLCPSCGYPLRGEATGCPECGWRRRAMGG